MKLRMTLLYPGPEADDLIICLATVPFLPDVAVSLLPLESPVQTPLLETLLELDQAIFDALPIGVCACDVDGRIVRVNQRAIELWGRAPRLFDSVQRFCGCYRVESLEGDFIPPAHTPMARAVLAGESFDGAEAVVENADGKRWVARVNVAPLRDDEGMVVGAINCFQDVSREHETRRALERQQYNFNLAMLASNMGTWRYTCRITSASTMRTRSGSMVLTGVLSRRHFGLGSRWPDAALYPLVRRRRRAPTGPRSGSRHNPLAPAAGRRRRLFFLV